MCSAQPNGMNSDLISAVSRMVAVLSAFEVGNHSLGVSELSRRTGLPKSTTHRLVSEMVEQRLLEKIDTSGGRGGMRLGMRVFELGEVANSQRRLRDIAIPHMTDLREATRQTIHLAVVDGTDVVYIQILRGKDAPRMPSRMGGRVPAHATGVGKAILACSPPEVIDRVTENGLVAVGPRTTSAPGILRRELGRVRSSGVAYDVEESAAGVVCAASPVMGRDGYAMASLSVSGWRGQINARRMGAAVRTAALALSREIFVDPKLTDE